MGSSPAPGLSAQALKLPSCWRHMQGAYQDRHTLGHRPQRHGTGQRLRLRVLQNETSLSCPAARAIHRLRDHSAPSEQARLPLPPQVLSLPLPVPGPLDTLLLHNSTERPHHCPKQASLKTGSLHPRPSQIKGFIRVARPLPSWDLGFLVCSVRNWTGARNHGWILRGLKMWRPW